MSYDSAFERLASLLGPRLTRSTAELAAHGGSESYFAPAPPDAVAYPRSTSEVADIVRMCADVGCPVVAWGAGTSLEGHGQAIRGGLVVDFTKMDKVLDIRPEDMSATVQPGVTRVALNDALRDTGLFFPIDPGANATIGGMAATRASGTTAVRYGTMRDNVIATKSVLADGRIISTGSLARKSSAGYDLTALLVGSEGTLALMCEIGLRLYGQPEAVSAAICAFDGMHQAVAAVIDTVHYGIPVARIEFVDALTARAFNSYARADMPLLPHLMLEFHGAPAQVAENAARFGEIAADHGGRHFRWADKAEERNALWKLRHDAYYACLQLRPGARAIVTDICVPISNLAEVVDETAEDIRQSGLMGPIFGHVGDGNFHAILLIDTDDGDEVGRAKAVSGRMIARSLEAGGTMSGEHGVGYGKLDFMEAEHGPAWQVMSEIKRALDPKNILNPGKVVRLN